MTKFSAASLIEQVVAGEEPEEVLDQVAAMEPEMAPAEAEEAGGLPPNLSTVIDMLAEVRATVDKNPEMKNAEGIRKGVDELVGSVHDLAEMLTEVRALGRFIGTRLRSEILGKPEPPDDVGEDEADFGPKHPSIDDTITDPAEAAEDDDFNKASGATIEQEDEPEEDEEEDEEEEEEEEEGMESRRRRSELLKGDWIEHRGFGKCKVLAADAAHVLIETSTGHQSVVSRQSVKFLGEIMGEPADDVQKDTPQDTPELLEDDPEEEEAEETVVDQGSEEVGDGFGQNV